MSESRVLLGYHFTGLTLRDGRPLPAVGTLLEHKGDVVPCVSGLHASVEPFDALRYAPGPLLSRVELSGDLQEHNGNKWVGRTRRVLARLDLTPFLRRVACGNVLRVLNDWPEAPAILREFLTSPDETRRVAAQTAVVAATKAAAWDGDYEDWGEACQRAGRVRRLALAAVLPSAWIAAWGTSTPDLREDFNARVVETFQGIIA